MVEVVSGEAGNQRIRYRDLPVLVGHELRIPDGRRVLQDMTVKPEDSKLTANSTCCFYPVLTPKGTRVVDFAPDDHPHHRGIFLAWHNIQGKPGGDFWGWGKFAPTEGRVIRNRIVKLKRGTPLHLRYRLVVHDGPLPRAVVDKAAQDFARE